MNKEVHYQSYRESVARDVQAMPGVVEFAKLVPTANPDLFPTMSDYLIKATAVLKTATGEAYKQWVLGHQAAMLGLFERFVQASNLSGLGLIGSKGWRWFRFSKHPIMLHGACSQIWIPRYTRKVDDVCFDAEEMEQILGRKDREFARSVYARKQNSPTKLISDGQLIPLDEVNKDRVRDWTLGLFV